MKSPRDVAKVVDADWTGSDRPVLATAEGCVQVFDLALKSCSCGIEDREFPGTINICYMKDFHYIYLEKKLNLDTSDNKQFLTVAV